MDPIAVFLIVNLVCDVALCLAAFGVGWWLGRADEMRRQSKKLHD